MCRDLWNWQTKNPEGYTGSVPIPAEKPSPLPIIAYENGVNAATDAVPPVQKEDEGELGLPGALRVAALTIPTEGEIFDPSTPAHVSPAPSEDGNQHVEGLAMALKSGLFTSE